MRPRGRHGPQCRPPAGLRPTSLPLPPPLFLAQQPPGPPPSPAPPVFAPRLPKKPTACCLLFAWSQTSLPPRLPRTKPTIRTSLLLRPPPPDRAFAAGAASAASLRVFGTPRHFQKRSCRPSLCSLRQFRAIDKPIGRPMACGRCACLAQLRGFALCARCCTAASRWVCQGLAIGANPDQPIAMRTGRRKCLGCRTHGAVPCLA
jgi:hypothetical protein